MTTTLESLARFVNAQANGEFEGALAEIKAGRKESHWIWYIFPQLAGLGTSSMSQTYAIRDRDEAIAYLRHPLLAPRLREIAGAAAAHLEKGTSIGTLMGSRIDASKLVSSMTLFAEVAHRLPPGEQDATSRAIAATADAILAAAAQQGYPRCDHTVARLGD